MKKHLWSTNWFRYKMIWRNQKINTGYLLDYEYINDHYRLIALNLSRQIELDADSKAVHQIEFHWRIKKN